MSDDVIKYSSDNQEVISGAVLPEDQEPDILSLRPERLSAYVGQEEVVETLKIAIQAATERGEPIDHVIFHGPPGLGKTTLAHIIAHEMQGSLTVTSGPALEKGGDLVGILTHLEEGDILFIDEIHRTPNLIKECMHARIATA
jgi:Holliday junction DNA helicase RuvB